MITITEKAKNEINRVVNEFGLTEKPYLRIRVVGGGCSGFKYVLNIDEFVNEKLDDKLDIDGVSVVIDKRSMMYIEGAVIDYLDDLNERGFKVINPNAKSTCGCGSSFSF